METVDFVSQDRGTFGGNNYNFVGKNSAYKVCVCWALIIPHETVILKDGEQVWSTHENRYIMPREALESIGVSIKGFTGMCSITGIPEEICLHCGVANSGFGNSAYVI